MHVDGFIFLFCSRIIVENTIYTDYHKESLKDHLLGDRYIFLIICGKIRGAE